MKQTENSKNVFIKSALAIGLPILLQQFLIQGMRLLDSLMIGSLGEKEVIAVGNACQVSFLLYVFLFGAASAAAVFTAQFWGKGDTAGIKCTLSVTMLISLIIALPFFIVGQFFPAAIMRFMNPDPEIVRLGVSFLKIDSLSYFFYAMTIALTNVLKGTTQTKLPLLTSFIAVSLNAVINYIFIFGNFGLPKLGVAGAALGTSCAVTVEFIAIFSLSKRKNNPVNFKLREINLGGILFLKHFMHKSIPIMINEILWAVGNFAFVLIYNRMGETTAAAMAIFVVLERMCYVVYIGLGHTAGILVGNKIGERDEKQAYEFGRKFLIAGTICAFGLGAVMFGIRGAVAGLYNITDDAAAMLNKVLIVFSCISWTSVFNFINIVGVLRGGGDTLFAAFIDLGGMYILSLPLAAFLGLYIKLPVYLVYLFFILAGDAFKMILGIRRFKSGKWINNLVEKEEILVQS